MSHQYYYIRDLIRAFWSRSFKTRFENKIRQSIFMASAFGPSGKARGVPTELPENRIAFEEEYQALVDSIIISVRDLVTCEVLEGDYNCKEPYRVKERLDKYLGWSSGTLATLRTLFRALDTTKSCLLSHSDFVKFLDLMGESSSDHERKVRISTLMKSNDEVDLDEFLDMVYEYSQHEEGKLGELASRVFVYSIKQECMNKGDVAESMKQCFV